jgi:hypothetical protein
VKYRCGIQLVFLKFLSRGILSSLFLLTGCNNQPLDHRQRYVDGWRQFVSHNGLGVHRRIWEQLDVRCYAPLRLSERLNKVDVIVLASSTFDPPGKKARQWLENWLRERPGRSVIYFGRDFDASGFYFQQTIDQLSPAQQVLAQRRIAESKVAEIQDRLGSYSEDTFCDWFYLRTDQEPREVSGLAGTWSNELESWAQGSGPGEVENAEQLESLESGAQTGNKSSKLSVQWPVRTRLLPPSVDFKEQPPSWITAPAATNPMKPIQSPWAEIEGKLLERSVWTPQEYNTREEWDSAFEQLLESQVLLESPQGDPLLFQLTHPERLGKGQILIVANGAPFLNASLIQPQFFEIGELIVRACLPAERVALLNYGNDGLQIYQGEEADLRGAGLEMLLNWPLSAITMSAALLGIVGLAYLLPILGRPQDLPGESPSDFGMHVEAIGQMLHETGDRAYAHAVINDYHRIVRGEHPPSWLDHPPAP